MAAWDNSNATMTADEVAELIVSQGIVSLVGAPGKNPSRGVAKWMYENMRPDDLKDWLSRRGRWQGSVRNELRHRGLLT